MYITAAVRQMAKDTEFHYFLSYSTQNCKLPAAKKVFNVMEALGLCQKASSLWSSPLHNVAKKDGTLHPCSDYRRLNMLMEPDYYPLPNIADITTNLHGVKIFSKLHLLKGYYQVPMNHADISKTAIATPFGT